MSRPGRKKINTDYVYISDKLKAKFDKMGEYPLTSIEAPIGYGKTKSCLEYLKNSGKLYLWSNIPGRDCSVFWEQFCNTMELVDRRKAATLREGGLPESHAAVEKAAEIIGRFKSEKPIIIVIDTTQDSYPENIAYLFELLARANSQYLHFVVIGRGVFRNNREELRMKHLLLIIDVFDMTLDRDDIVKYYEKCGVPLSMGDAESLRRRTDGWIAPLYLTLLHYDTGESRRLMVSDQIFGIFSQTLCIDYTDDQMDFLKRICPFRKFTLEQARSVRRLRDPADVLSRMVNACGFIWKIPETQKYQINRLFREYLLELLEAGDPKFRSEVFRNAADWYYRNAFYGRAADFYYRCGDYENMLKAFELDRGEHLCADDVEPMIRTYRRCPEETMNRHYIALMIYARQLAMCGMNEELEEVLNRLKSKEVLDVVPEQERTQFEGESELLDAYLTYRDPSLSASYQMRCAKKLGSGTAQTGRMSPITFGSPSMMLLAYSAEGNLDDLVKKYSDMSETYYSLTDSNARGSEYMFEAEAHFSRGNLDRADILSHKAGTVASRYGQTGTGLCAYFMQSRISLLKGDTDRGTDYLSRISDVASRVDKRVYSTTAELCEAYVYAVFNQLKYVADWIYKGEFATGGGVSLYGPPKDFAYMVYSRILLDNEEYSKYLGMADGLIEDAVKNNKMLPQIYYQVYRAAAYRKMGLDDWAAESLKKAVDLASTDGIIMPFAENGRFINEMYEKVDFDAREREFVGKCRELYGKYAKHMNVLLRAGGDPAISMLTRREQEISMLVADGKTNMQIAKELNIAEITVKKSLSNIYSRLGIPNRASLIKMIIS